MATAKKLPRGKPFQKGGDPRRNTDGRPRTIGTAALRRIITDDDLEKMWRQTITDAIEGDKDARRDILDRLEGKAVTRAENGEPGEFDAELGADERERLRAALQVVRGRRNA